MHLTVLLSLKRPEKKLLKFSQKKKKTLSRNWMGLLHINWDNFYVHDRKKENLPKESLLK